MHTKKYRIKTEKNSLKVSIIHFKKIYFQVTIIAILRHSNLYFLDLLYGFSINLKQISQYSNSKSHIIRQHFLQLINKFPQSSLYYIDGSKTDHITSYAFFIQNNTFSSKLEPSCSIFTAELTAIFLRLIKLFFLNPNHHILFFTTHFAPYKVYQIFIQQILSINVHIPRIFTLFQFPVTPKLSKMTQLI